MSTITFDTHEFIKELKNAGFSEEQAEIITKLKKAAVASTLEQARHDYDLKNLVTNHSLDSRVGWVASFRNPSLWGSKCRVGTAST